MTLRKPAKGSEDDFTRQIILPRRLNAFTRGLLPLVTGYRHMRGPVAAYLDQSCRMDSVDLTFMTLETSSVPINQVMRGARESEWKQSKFGTTPISSNLVFGADTFAVHDEKMHFGGRDPLPGSRWCYSWETEEIV